MEENKFSEHFINTKNSLYVDATTKINEFEAKPR